MGENTPSPHRLRRKTPNRRRGMGPEAEFDLSIDSFGKKHRYDDDDLTESAGSISSVTDSPSAAPSASSSRKGSFSIGSCPADAFSSVSGLTERIQHLLELNASHQASKDDEQEQSSKRLPLINNDVDMGRTPPKLRMGADGIDEVVAPPSTPLNSFDAPVDIPPATQQSLPQDPAAYHTLLGERLDQLHARLAAISGRSPSRAPI